MRRRVRAKICGITRSEDARAASELGADAVGFVFAESPRQIDVARARQICEDLPPFLIRVGLFVDSDPGMVRDVARDVPLDVVQLHGDETPQFCASLMDLRVIKAFRIGDPMDLEEISRFRTVHSVLLDAKVEGVHGGTGLSFPWEWLASWKAPKPWILAGGLNADNVREAVLRLKPYAVDVSSGVEIGPGLKSMDKMRHFMEVLHQINGT